MMTTFSCTIVCSISLPSISSRKPLPETRNSLDASRHDTRGSEYISLPCLWGSIDRSTRTFISYDQTQKNALEKTLTEFTHFFTINQGTKEFDAYSQLEMPFPEFRKYIFSDHGYRMIHRGVWATSSWTSSRLRTHQTYCTEKSLENGSLDSTRVEN